MEKGEVPCVQGQEELGSEARQSVKSLFDAGTGYHAAGQLALAERCYRQALAVDPLHADTWHLLGIVAHQTGQNRMAAEIIRKAIGLNAHCADYHCNLGSVLQALQRPEEGEACYRRALSLDPRHSKAHNNLGNALKDSGRLEEAVAHYRCALALREDDADVHNNLGTALVAQGKLDEAAASYGRALILNPGHAEAHYNYGAVFHSLGSLDRAMAHYDLALAHRPDYAQAQVNKAMVELIRGDFASGFRRYEWRWRLKSVSAFKRDFAAPQWSGEPIKGARILLHSEQGLGDCLQFLRYVPMVAAAGGIVVLEVPARLRRLVERFPGAAEIFALGEELPVFDCHCPLMSLPLAFGTSLATIPGEVPYLSVSKEAWRKARSLPWPLDGLRVGLVWAGSPGHIKDRLRSIPFALLRPLFGVQGAHFFSLQLGEAAGEVSGASSAITDLAPATADMADTAAQIAHLDVVISVDTSVAHLAGAMAKSVWLLLLREPDWRWLLERDESPWYPTMRIFRQAGTEDPRGVIDRVASSLAELARLRADHFREP
jgi:Tfp pilus assembly protein PilF